MQRHLLLAVVLLVVPFLLCAQDTATIVGTVTDQTGAVVVGAKVTISNPEKGFVRNVVTGAAGEYSAYAIPIGNYQITVEASNFNKVTQKGITLNVGQIQRIDVKLTVGAVSQEVTVEANAPKVQTENATISDVVVSRQIENTNLNGRNWVSLAMLVAGAAATNDLDVTHVGVYGNNSISFNGNRTQYNNWEIDGGPNTDEGSASTFNTYPNLETIAEFRVSTSNYGADLGRHSGATIELATKSGTRDFHGAAFEYLRNDKLDAQDWFLNRQGTTEKRPLKWNDWGYTFGGPFYIPKVYNTDKQKTFFFWSQGWKRQREGQIISSTVPTFRMRNGDFSECDPKSSNYVAVVAAGCEIPSLNGTSFTDVKKAPLADPQAFTNAKILLDAMVPLPNNGPTGYQSASSTVTNWRQEQIRVDQKISEKVQAFVRYTSDSWYTLAVPALWSAGDADTIKTPFYGPGKSAVAHLTTTFKPNLVNEFVMGYTVDHILLYYQVGESSVSKSLTRPADFKMNHLFPANAGNPLLPSISVSGGAPGFSEDASNVPWFNSNPVFTWKDNLIWTRGKHTIKTGFFLEKYRKNEQFGAQTQGFLYFDTGSSVSSGNALADMFLGRIQQYQEGTLSVNGVGVGGYPKGHWRMTALEPYFQDDWKVTPRLTLNLGVRYHFFTRIHDVSVPSIDSNFLPWLYNPSKEAQIDADGNIVQGSGHFWNTFGNGLVECGKNGIPLGCQQRNTALNFAPRFGFSYDPFGTAKWVIRGGYGLYYEAGNGNESQTEGAEGNPPANFAPSGYDIIGYNNIKPGAVGPSGYTAVAFDQRWPTLQQFNVSVQHQFGGDNLLTVAYVGALGRHLARGMNINQVHPGAGTMNVPVLAGGDGCDANGNCDVQAALIRNLQSTIFFVPYRGYSNINYRENAANSVYNSLQTTFRHNFSHGLMMQAAYTWSHNIDDTSSYTGVGRGGINDYDASRWRASSGLDRRQMLQLNYIYELPFFKKSNAILKQAFGGWQLSGITSFISGPPTTPSCSRSGYHTGVGGGFACNSSGPIEVVKGTFNDPVWGPSPYWWDPTPVQQITQPQLHADNQSGMFGYLGRNVLTTPGRNNWDMALMKEFSLGAENRKLQFRWETFNTFNHPQWRGVSSGCSNRTPFGDTCADRAYNVRTGAVTSAWPARIMQFGMKFSF